MVDDDENIVWQAPEYLYKEKDSDWFWAVGIITVAGIISAYMFGNLLLAVLVFLIGFTVVLFGVRKPNEITFEINRKGVQAENTLYPFQTLKSFWVLEKENENLLLLTSQKILSTQITVPLGSIDPDMVRIFLSDYLLEIEDVESIAQRSMDYLGF